MKRKKENNWNGNRGGAKGLVGCFGVLWRMPFGGMAIPFASHDARLEDGAQYVPPRDWARGIKDGSNKPKKQNFAGPDVITHLARRIAHGMLQ